jgi:hypothetical protein
MSERDRGDRPKKSWRELDNMRDKPRASSPRPEQGQSRAQEERASKAYRAQLDALFERGEVGKFAEKMVQSRSDAPAGPAPPMPAPKKPEPAAAPEPPKEDDPRSVLRKKIMTAIGRDEISRAVDKYVKAHGMPRDFEVLEQALEHNKTDRQAEAMDQLDKLLAREKPKRSRTLAGKLRFIEETSDSSDLREQAARIRAKL